MRGVRRDEGVWLAHQLGWNQVAAFPDKFAAIGYVSEQEDPGRWDVAFAPYGRWFGPGCVVVEGSLKRP